MNFCLLAAARDGKGLGLGKISETGLADCNRGFFVHTHMRRFLQQSYRLDLSIRTKNETSKYAFKVAVSVRIFRCQVPAYTGLYARRTDPQIGLTCTLYCTAELGRGGREQAKSFARAICKQLFSGPQIGGPMHCKTPRLLRVGTSGIPALKKHVHQQPRKSYRKRHPWNGCLF